jgi:tripartite-type tricarboxylate transporter receptor subunit TctC
VQATISRIPASIDFIKAGKLRALAVTSASRSELLPDTPAVDEFVPGYEATAWFGIGAPKGTPADVIDSLNTAINAGLADAILKTRLLALGAEPSAMAPGAFGKFIAAETEKWGKVIRAANIKPE